MKALVAIKAGEFIFPIKCDRCTGGFYFPLSLERNKAIELLKSKEGWVQEGKHRLLCDGCSGMVKTPKLPKAAAPKISLPKKEEVVIDEDGCIQLD
jgi:hypothetical protein